MIEVKGKNTGLLTKLLAILIVGGIVMGGCTIATIGGRRVIPAMLNTPPERVEVIKHVKVSKSIYFDYTAAYDASEILAKVIEETGADAIINVAIKLKITVVNYLINVITFGLANGRTIEIEADAVKLPRKSSLLLLPGIRVLAESASLVPLISRLLREPPEPDVSDIIIRVGEKENAVRYVLIRCPVGRKTS